MYETATAAFPEKKKKNQFTDETLQRESNADHNLIQLL